jgi:hypothetical protein
MSVQGINNTNAGAVLAPVVNTSKASESSSTEDLVNSVLKPNTEADSFVKSNPADATKATYTRDSAKIAELKAGDQAYLDGLQSLVSTLISQYGKAQISDGQAKLSLANTGDGIDPSKIESAWDFLVQNSDGTWSIDPSLPKEAQDALIAKAKEDISEDGYYGVRKTSERILDYAKAVTGGDPSKIALMRKSIEKSFEDVRKMVGGELPEISQKTYEAVMKGLDEWAESAK